MKTAERLFAAALLAVGGCDKASNSPEAPAAPPPLEAAAPQADAQLHRVLSEIADEEGLVHYEKFNDPKLREALKVAIDGYGSTPLPERIEVRKAMLCNAYNANVIGLIVDHGGSSVKSVKDVAGFFDQIKITVGLNVMSLDELHQQIRSLGDPRVHGVLVLGARGGPPMPATAFVPDRLDAQFASQVRRWVEEKNRVTDRGLAISEVFKWYQDDFKVQPYGGVVGFIRKHASTHSSIRDFMQSQPDLELSYLNYDWRLNQARSAETIAVE